MANHQGYETAIFAGGCFWCTQSDFDTVKGVISTIAGYTGGYKANPTYEEVCEGNTGHVEALQVTFDPQQVSYEQLLDFYWQSIDPTQNDGQFCDIGPQYRPIIFYQNTTQKRLAEASKQKLINASQPIVVDTLPAQPFYPAEAYHQKYYKKNSAHYQSYRQSSGRDG